MPSTILDVARRASVSPSTVSRVVNQGRGRIRISRETKANVLRVVKELGYKANPLARGLVGGKTETIGIVFPDLQSLFMLKVLEERARESGYNVMFSVSEDSVKLEKQCCETFVHRRVDGIIIAAIPAGESNAQYLLELIKEGLPVVLINEALEEYTGPSVLIDNEAGGRQVVEHLIGLGHTRIAYIGGPTWIAGYKDRLSGYKKAHEGKELKWKDELMEIVEKGTTENGYAAMTKLLKSTRKPTAVFCSTDMLAIGAMKAVGDCGMKVPDDISIAGFDDIEVGSYLDVPLTTVNQGREEIGELAVKMLIEVINGNEPKQQNLVIKPRLIVRRSCGKPPGGASFGPETAGEQKG